MIDEHDLHMEDTLWPWLAEDCMADEAMDADPFEDLEDTDA